VKIEIEIPDPPEGWVYDAIRQGTPGEKIWSGVVDGWRDCGICTGYKYPVAVKAKPPWEPLPELIAIVRPGWVTRNKGGYCRHHIDEPKKNANWGWYSCEMNSLEAIRPDLLPPETIPWDQCCFKIGEPE
jgi:hypothetical protein